MREERDHGGARSTDVRGATDRLGRVADLDAAPRQGDEGAPEAVLVIDPTLRDAMSGLAVGDDVIVLTWLDRARRDVLHTRPRGDPTRPETGVFSTRAPDRPNPIGLHAVTIVGVEGTRIRVHGLEAIDQTPVLDIKPVIGTLDQR